MIKKMRLSPILKWPGGKERELKNILPVIPDNFSNFYEPFIGGGAVYLSIEAKRYYINDKSHELIALYNAIHDQDSIFYDELDHMMQSWKKLDMIVENNKTLIIDTYSNFSDDNISVDNIEEFILTFVENNFTIFSSMYLLDNEKANNHLIIELKKNMLSKIKRMKKIEIDKGKLPETDILDNFLSSLKSAYYMYIRHLHNHISFYAISNSLESAIFFFIRNFTYSGMFRYNNSGHFNVPYGGIGYNKKNFNKKISYFKSNILREHLLKTDIENLDFEDFFQKHKPSKDDFIFLDPPYDTEFSTYAQNDFGKEDQKRLASYLLNKCDAKWMMVIKNTDFISSLYDHDDLYVTSFDKKYQVSFMDRNEKNVEHLLITNYEVCS